MIEIIQVDKKVFLYLNNLGSDSFDQFWMMISSFWIWVPLYIIFLYLLYKNYRPRSFVFIVIFLAIGIIVSDEISEIIKYSTARLKPCQDVSFQKLMRTVNCDGKYGFYSALTSKVFFLAAYLSFLLKNKIRWFHFVVFTWAAIVGYSRIYLGMHFPGDILAGAIAGILLGFIFYLLAKKVIKKQNISQ